MWTGLDWTVVDPGKEPGQLTYQPGCMLLPCSPGMGDGRALEPFNHTRSTTQPLTGLPLWPARAWQPVTASCDGDSDRQTRKPSAAFRGGETWLRGPGPWTPGSQRKPGNCPAPAVDGPPEATGSGPGPQAKADRRRTWREVDSGPNQVPPCPTRR